MDDTQVAAPSQPFEGHYIRRIWDDENQQWLFSVNDVVQILSESSDTKQYIKKMRAREPGLNEIWSSLCTLAPLPAADGKRYRTTAAPLEGLFRIIQSIPSPKANSLKQWLAKVGAERIAEEEDPEIAIARARDSYLSRGYSPEWVDQRILSIRVRNELTDQWKEHGVSEPKDFAKLTSTVHLGTFGITPKEHKAKKGLKSQNLRDNMTTLETVLTMLGEATTTELTKVHNPDGLQGNLAVAKQGGLIAGQARRSIEMSTGKSVVSCINAKDLILGEDEKPSIEIDTTDSETK